MIARVKAGLDASGEDYRMMILPDHPTPIAARTHVSDPVPYLLYDSKNPQNHTWNYNEREVRAASGETVCGWDLMNHLLQQK